MNSEDTPASETVCVKTSCGEYTLHILDLQDPSVPEAVIVEIARLLKSEDEDSSPPLESIPRPASAPGANPQILPPLQVKRPQPSHPMESPAKKQSKWSPEEDELIISLRNSRMKWEDISKRLPGRSAISCRLHFQNYLERRHEWDEEKKNRLARLYERLKSEMWGRIAEEMGVPWRAAESMHWQLGEEDMCRRAGVLPFSHPSPRATTPPRGRRGSGSNHRARRESISRSVTLPSVAEMAAGTSGYAPWPYFPPDCETRSPLEPNVSPSEASFAIQRSPQDWTQVRQE